MSAIGIDLEAGRVVAVRVDESGRVTARAREIPKRGNLGHAARTAFGRVRAAGAALGIAMPFHADATAADVVSALTEAAGEAPVTVTTGQAVALAEAWCGAAQGSRHVIALSLGDHVTAGLLVDGQLLTGANGRAGAVAWLVMNPVEREDYRRHGGFEAEVASAGIVHRLVWRIKSGDESQVVERVAGDLTRLTADDVFAAARDGDSVCWSVVRDTAKYVGMAVANLVAIVDAECVVLAGTLATAGDLMLEPVRAEFARRLRPAHAEQVRIVLSTVGHEAAAIGAARAAMHPPR
jgi:glucokinase